MRVCAYTVRVCACEGVCKFIPFHKFFPLQLLSHAGGSKSHDLCVLCE